MSRKPSFLADRDRGAIDVDLSEYPEGGAVVNLDDKDPQAFTIIEEDDTPEKDRGKPTEVSHPTDAPTEDELRSYGAKAGDRIRRMTFERETERRGREQAERTANEATEYARRLAAENERLRHSSAATATALSTTMLNERTSHLANARARLAAAHNEGDGDAIAQATEEISTLTAEVALIKAQVPRAPEPGDQVERTPAPQRQQQAAPLDPNVAAWISDNRGWFGRPGYEDKTAVAYTVHDRLIQRGVRPNTDEYTRGLDEGLKKVFADHRSRNERDNPSRDRDPARRDDVVGGGSRRSTDAPASARSVVLTASQLRLANTLGVTPQAYAASLLKQQGQQKGSAR